jgi:molybdopterin/thiamine biosynthesis adenylyltransferase
MDAFLWQLTLIVRDLSVLDSLHAPCEIAGCLHEDERAGVLFLANEAPPGATTLGQLLPPVDGPWTLEPPAALKVVRKGGVWLAQGGSIPAATPVMLRTFSDTLARMPFKSEHKEVLSGCTAMFVGLGSIGCKILDLTVRAGVGGLVLVDVDRVSIENMSRHTADLLSINRWKVDYEAEASRRINPTIKITTSHDDITTWSHEDREKLMGSVNILIESTDRHNVKLAMMDWAIQRKLPIVYAGAYENGAGGEVLHWLGDETKACYGCIPREAEGPKNRTLDYSTAIHPEDYAAEPGLGAAVSLYACAAAQIVLASLLRHTDCDMSRFLGDDRYRYLLMGSAASQGFHVFQHPFQNLFQPVVGINPRCPIHHPDAVLKRLLTAE